MHDIIQRDCNNCQHSDVCMFRYTFEAASEQIKDATVVLDKNQVRVETKLSEISFLKVETRCSHHIYKAPNTNIRRA